MCCCVFFFFGGGEGLKTCLKYLKAYLVFLYISIEAGAGEETSFIEGPRRKRKGAQR